jgi:hypothetical protein
VSGRGPAGARDMGYHATGRSGSAFQGMNSGSPQLQQPGQTSHKACTTERRSRWRRHARRVAAEEGDSYGCVSIFSNGI